MVPLQEVTAVEFDEKTGFLMAVGSSAGKVSHVQFLYFYADKC